MVAIRYSWSCRSGPRHKESVRRDPPGSSVPRANATRRARSRRPAPRSTTAAVSRVTTNASEPESLTRYSMNACSGASRRPTSCHLGASRDTRLACWGARSPISSRRSVYASCARSSASRPACGAGRPLEPRSASSLGHVLEVARQLGDAAAQVLFAGHEVRGRVCRRGHAAPRQELEHLTRAQALARLKRRAGPAAAALGERELRIHFPFVREKRRAPLRKREGA